MTGNVNVEDVVRHAHQLGELVGLSLRSVNNCPMELNLRPTSVVNAQRIAARRPYLVAAGLCLLLALAGWWLYFLRAAAIKEKVLGDVNTQVSTMQGFESRFKKISGDINSVAAISAPLGQAVDDRQAWARIIGELNSKLPPKYIWITSLEPTVGGKPVVLGDPNRPLGAGPSGYGTPAPAKPGAAKVPAMDGLRVKGLYLYNEAKGDRVVSDYVANLASSSFFKLDTANEKTIILNRAPQNQTEWAFEYELQLNLAHPIPLQ